MNAARRGKVNALDGMGQWTEVIDIGKRALELYETIDDTDAIGRLSSLVGIRLIWWDRFGETVEITSLALDALPDVPSHHRSRLLGYLGVALNLLDEPGSLESIERGLAEAEELGDKSAVLYGKYSLSLWHFHRGSTTEAARIGEEGLELLEDSADQTIRSELLGHLVFGDIGDDLLFQVYEDVREEAKILDDRLMDPSGPNIVDFWLYAGFVVAELLVFLEDLVDLIAEHLDVSASPIGNTGNFKALAGSLDRLLGPV